LCGGPHEGSSKSLFVPDEPGYYGKGPLSLNKKYRKNHNLNIWRKPYSNKKGKTSLNNLGKGGKKSGSETLYWKRNGRGQGISKKRSPSSHISRRRTRNREKKRRYVHEILP